MSRFNIQVNGENVSGRHLAGHPKNATYNVAFGYDNPLSEYFIHVEQLTGDIPEPKNEYDDNPGLMFAVSSYNTMKCHPNYPRKFKWSNSELLELFEAWGTPPMAVEALALDLPF